MELIRVLNGEYIAPTSDINNRLISMGSAPIRNQVSLAQIVRRPEISIFAIGQLSDLLNSVPTDIALQAEVEIKYSGYIDRQTEMVERFRKIENVRLPDNLNYADIRGLSREVCEKLSRIKPRSLGQASRISGMTPAAISLLSVYLRKKKTA
jgi:tRNA uridine 5-carboxymethylaminomethyl modification enzyme